jgi:hypothetical protein
MLRKIRQFGLKNAAPGPDRMRAAVNRDAILPAARKTAIIRLKFSVHPGNPVKSHGGNGCDLM